MIATKILIKPIVTEKSYKLLEKEVYLFVVHQKANKKMVKQAFESVFGVKVADVNLSIRKRKPKTLGRFHGYKKAIKKAYIKICAGQNFTFLKDESTSQAETPAATSTKKGGWSFFNRFRTKNTDVKPIDASNTSKVKSNSNPITQQNNDS